MDWSLKSPSWPFRLPSMPSHSSSLQRVSRRSCSADNSKIHAHPVAYSCQKFLQRTILLSIQCFTFAQQTQWNFLKYFLTIRLVISGFYHWFFSQLSKIYLKITNGRGCRWNSKWGIAHVYIYDIIHLSFHEWITYEQQEANYSLEKKKADLNMKKTSVHA